MASEREIPQTTTQKTRPTEARLPPPQCGVRNYGEGISIPDWPAPRIDPSLIEKKLGNNAAVLEPISPDTILSIRRYAHGSSDRSLGYIIEFLPIVTSSDGANVSQAIGHREGNDAPTPTITLTHRGCLIGYTNGWNDMKGSNISDNLFRRRFGKILTEVGLGPDNLDRFHKRQQAVNRVNDRDLSAK